MLSSLNLPLKKPSNTNSSSSMMGISVQNPTKKAAIRKWTLYWQNFHQPVPYHKCTKTSFAALVPLRSSWPPMPPSPGTKPAALLLRQLVSLRRVWALGRRSCASRCHFQRGLAIARPSCLLFLPRRLNGLLSSIGGTARFTRSGVTRLGALALGSAVLDLLILRRLELGS